MNASALGEQQRAVETILILALVAGATLSGQYRFSKDTNLNFSYEDTRTKGVSGRNWPQLDWR